jgi:hypothetical protein
LSLMRGVTFENMKLATTISRALHENMQAELRDIERAVAAARAAPAAASGLSSAVRLRGPGSATRQQLAR